MAFQENFHLMSPDVIVGSNADISAEHGLGYSYQEREEIDRLNGAVALFSANLDEFEI